MDEAFSIEVVYKNQQQIFEARLVAMGYTHKFIVIIDGVEVVYEPDEERNYRAIIAPSTNSGDKNVDVELVKTIGDKIQSIF